MSNGDSEVGEDHSVGTEHHYGDDVDALLNLLEDVGTIDRFAFALQEKLSSGPDLHLANVGPISLPMHSGFQHQMLRLSAHSCQPALKRTTAPLEGRTWHLPAEMLAATNPDWAKTVSSLAAVSSKELGVSDISHMEPVLQCVSISVGGDSYRFDPLAETPPGTFATMIVLLLQPGLEMQASVYQASQTKPFRLRSADACLGCIAYLTGCQHALHCKADGCYVTMVHHLVQAGGAPVVIRDQAWYLEQLDHIMDRNFEDCASRAFYMFDDKYRVDKLTNNQDLPEKYQKMGQVLQAAEQRQILDVYLVIVTHEEYCTRHCGEAEVEDSNSRVTSWRSLDGGDPGWPPDDIHMTVYGDDSVLQGEEWLNEQDTDRESESEGDDNDEFTEHTKHVRLTKYKYRAGFVMWPRTNRWLIFCRQGISAAVLRLGQMLEQLGPSLGQAPAPPAHQAPSQAWAPDPAAAQDSCRGEVASLVQAMYHTFEGSLDAVTVPGFESFGAVALALGQAGIYTGLLNIRLAGKCLDLGTAQQLMSASKHVDWTTLGPILLRMAQSVIGLHDPLDRCVAIPEAALLLLDVKESDASMRPPVAAIASVATSLVNSVQQLASRGSLLAQQTQTSTKPWQNSIGRGAAKACCNLVVFAFRLFESLQVRACKDVQLCHVLEKAACGLVEVCLANPQYFYVTEVLGPACIAIAEAEANAVALTQSPAGIKLMAGCVQQLRQAAQLQQLPSQQQRCTCSVCQSLQACLAAPEQKQGHGLLTLKQAEHATKELQHDADRAGHVRLEQPSTYGAPLQCTRESYADKSTRIKTATLMLERIEPMFSEVVVGLFQHSGRSPPEEFTVPEPEPHIQLYSLWQHVKPMPA